MTKIKLPSALYKQLIIEAQAFPEVEVCGLLGGHVETCTALYPVKNISPDPRHSFYMDPQSQITAMRAMQSNDQTMLGIYHSHPRTAALPSLRDTASAAYPEVAYIIISLAIPEQPEAAAFMLNNGQFEPISLVVDL